MDNDIDINNENGPIHDGTFLDCDGHKLYFKNEDGSLTILPVKRYHSPYCLVMCDDNVTPGKYRDTTASVISQIQDKISEANEDFETDSPYKYIKTDDDGNLKYTNQEVWRSFHNPNIRYRCFQVHTVRSYKVPDVSTALFKDLDLPTAEFDIPYRNRAVIDLQADERLWYFDTGGEVQALKFLAYDIETTRFQETVDSEPGTTVVDIIGWSSFEFKYKAQRDKNGRCVYETAQIPEWTEPKIYQSVAHTETEEVEHLVNFIKLVREHDGISGHNVVSFDNRKVWERLQFFRGYRFNEDKKRWLKDDNAPNIIPDDDRKVVDEFIEKYSRPDKIFFFGELKDAVNFYPISFDTYFASKQLYRYFSEFNLKALAKTFGYVIPDRVYLDPVDQSIETPEKEKRTLKYNEDDVREQLALTIHLLPDAVRLSHLKGMSLSDCMPAGTTNIWDTVTFVKARQNHRIMPARASVYKVCRSLLHRFGTQNPKTNKPYTKMELFKLAQKSLQTTNPVSQKVLKVLKYGNEAPDYVMYPHLICNLYDSKTLHAITTRNCPCNDCKAMVDIKHCDCDYCKSLRRKYPGGLNAKDEQVEFILSELKKYHPEDDETLLDMITYDRGFRNKKIGYHFPGGLTIHPDEVSSEFKFWWGIKVADVGSMYPANLRAENIGGDTTRFASPWFYTLDGDKITPKKNSFFKHAKESYKWVWIKRARFDIIDYFFIYITAKELHSKSEYERLSEEFESVDRGYLVAIVVDDEPGGISEGMQTILDVTSYLKKKKLWSLEADSGATDRQKMQIANAYQSMKAMRNSGTHGIISAPTVSCRQFCLSGASRITTLGQCILKDAIHTFDSLGVRKVYGDTDGIYFATSKDARAVYDEKQTNRYPMKEIFDIDGEGKFFVDPELIDQTVEHVNKKWQDILDYPSYELEIENEDGMMFAKHKNYLKFHHKFDDDGKAKFVFNTKGNNFKAKDKPKISTNALEMIMKEVIKRHLQWDDEDDEYRSVRSDIKEVARGLVKELDPDKLSMDNFSVRQVVKPMGTYKQGSKNCKKCDGSGCEYCAGTGRKLSTYSARSNAMSRLLGVAINTPVAVRCVVCEKPLPLLEGARKSDSKPIAYLWPVEVVENSDYKDAHGGIDLDWYVDAVFNYIKGGFSFDEWNIKPWVCISKQARLDGGFYVKVVSGKNFAKRGKKAPGKTITCGKETFDRLTVNEPVPDDVMEWLMDIDPDLIEKTFEWGEGYDDEDEGF